MTLTGNQLCREIIIYQKNERGVAWNIFWNYKCKIEKRGENIFSDKHIRLTSMHLFIYLCCFGMARSKTGLADSDIDVFTRIIKNVRRQLNKIRVITFEELNERHRQVINECYEAIRIELTKKGNEISGTETMVTKILMACWGQTPAYDRFFVSTYREYLKPKHGDYFDSLLKLKGEYDNFWKKSINALPRKYRVTKEGYKIPPARLIDMAFWELAQ